MKVIVHKTASGVVVSHLSPSLLALMSDSGYGWDSTRISYEVGKFVKDGKSEGVIRPYIEALANGGKTEAEAIELIRAKDDHTDCIRCTVIEDTDLPADRYFRNAWECID